MTDTPTVTTERSYGCSMGCGNPYDFIVTTVEDGTTLFLCAPDFIRIAAEMTEAIVNPGNPGVRQVVADNPAPEQAPHTFDPVTDPATPIPVASDDDLCPDCGSSGSEQHKPSCVFAV